MKDKILHIFNPEHDMALASGSRNYTPPRIIRQMREELSWLPRLWAEEGDSVWPLTGEDVGRVEPWGWDSAVRETLLKAGVAEEILPTNEFIADVRRLSSREMAVKALQEMRSGGNEDLCGESWWCRDIEDVIAHEGRIVIKAPWSSSGKGLLFADGRLTEKQKGWVRNVIGRQGGVAVERLCEKRHDFALEYVIGAERRADCLGISVFVNNTNGSYGWNMLCPHNRKLEMLGLDEERIKRFVALHKAFLEKEIAPYYTGPVGIDMMECDGGIVNPCVEINLRRTMGHVALAIEQKMGTRKASRFVVGYDKARGYFAEVRE